MAEERIERSYPGYATELLRYESGAWIWKIHDVDLLVDALGENLVWALARCFEAADRLMSLGRLVPGDQEYADAPTRAQRDHFAVFWLSVGTMRELSLALGSLPGLRKRFADNSDDLRVVYSLQAIEARCNADSLVRVRNAMSFHLDAEKQLFRSGMADVRKEGEPLILAQGDNTRHGTASFPLGRDLFTRGLWPEKPERFTNYAELNKARVAELQAFAGMLVQDQTRVGALLQRLLVALLKPGCHIRPEHMLEHHRHRLVEVLSQKMKTPRDLVEEARTLCKALRVAIDATAGTPSDAEGWVLDAEALSAKCHFHANSCLLLANGTPISGSSGLVIDFSSLDSLARTTLESALAFHHVFAAPKTSEDIAFRHLSWICERPADSAGI